MYPTGSTVQLYTQASTVFSQLDVNNVFLGERNTFRDVEARRICLTSDVRRKRDIRTLSRAEATDLVRRLSVFTYSIDNRRAAGVMALTVPAQYSENNTVDYISLLMHLWVSVQDIHQKIDQLQKRKKHRSKKSPDGLLRRSLSHAPSGTGWCYGHRSVHPPSVSVEQRFQTQGTTTIAPQTTRGCTQSEFCWPWFSYPDRFDANGLLVGYLLQRVMVSSLTDPQDKEEEFFNQYSIEGMNDTPQPPKRKDDEEERKKKSLAKSLLPIGVIGGGR